MRDFVVVPVEVLPADYIDGVESETETIKVKIRSAHVSTYYPLTQGGVNFSTACGESWYSKLSMNDFERLLWPDTH